MQVQWLQIEMQQVFPLAVQQLHKQNAVHSPADQQTIHSLDNFFFLAQNLTVVSACSPVFGRGN